jgi:4-hydroxybenzoyl-CoA reductase subunit beta
MTTAMPEVVLLRPATLAEATALRRRHPESRILAGGTDLVTNMRRGIVEAATLIDLSSLAELRSIEAADGGLRIGAAVTIEALTRDETVRRGFAAVAEAGATIAGPGHRAAATVAGNLCLDTRCLYYNQSEWWRRANGYCLKLKGDTCHVAPQGKLCRAAFSGDLAPALMVHDAVVEIAGSGGMRRLPLADLYAEDGARHLRLEPGEFLAAVRLPASTARSAYAKARVRDSIDFPLAGVAASLASDEPGVARLAVAVTGTNSRPVLIEGLEGSWNLPPDEAALARLDKLVQKQVSPMRTTMTAAHYRRLAAAALARRLLIRLAGERTA